MRLNAKVDIRKNSFKPKAAFFYLKQQFIVADPGMLYRTLFMKVLAQ